MLYERYSELAFTFATDRAVAIIGLERRLLKTFKTEGGFGILNLYLHRSLLWSTSGSCSATRLKYSYEHQIPSWSWMSLDGCIRYLDIPLGETEWSEDIVSPFTTKHTGDSRIFWAVNKGYPVPELIAKAQTFVLSADNEIILKECLIFDTEAITSFQGLSCVIVGRDKGRSKGGKYYVLVIRPVSTSNEPERYERVGVGRVERSCILFWEPAWEVHII
jgi:hypothetical protein